MGTAGELPKGPTNQPKFIEDLSEEQLATTVRFIGGWFNQLCLSLVGSSSRYSQHGKHVLYGRCFENIPFIA